MRGCSSGTVACCSRAPAPTTGSSRRSSTATPAATRRSSASTSPARSRASARPRPPPAVLMTAASAPSTPSTPASGSSRSTAPATSTARSASPTRGPAGTSTGSRSSLEQVEAMLDAFVRAEGEPESVQISGGEPSIHPEILAILRAARERGIPLVMLNTNGIRLARDPRFAPALAEIGVHVYLQFDGFEEATQRAIRGRPLTEEKLRALERCAEAGVSVSLAAAVERGINEHEVGEVVRFGVEHPAVTGVFFQPVTHSGRFRADADPLAEADQLGRDRRRRRPAARVVPRGGLRPGPLLLADLPLGHLRALRRRGPGPAAAPGRRRALPRLRHQPRRPRPRRPRRRWRGCGRRRRPAAASRSPRAWTASPARPRCRRSCARSRHAGS